MRRGVAQAIGIIGGALAVSWLIQRPFSWPVEPMPTSSVRATTHGDPMVTHLPENRILRVELDRMPQDYLVCLGERCLLPAEWRGGAVSVVYGPLAVKIRVMTSIGEVREFWITTIPDTAGVVFTPAELDPIAHLR